MVWNLLHFLLSQVLRQVLKLSLSNVSLSTDQVGDLGKDGSYAIEDWFVELEVLLLNLSDGGLHFLLNLADLLVTFVDGNGLDLFREGKFLNALLHLLQSDLALLLS
jgi:hypothetical protein